MYRTEENIMVVVTSKYTLSPCFKRLSSSGPSGTNGFTNAGLKGGR